MAIYHLSGSIISRSQGRSAIASAAYRSGEKFADEKQGSVHDYSKKQDVVYTEIFLPEGAPESFKNREVLWNAVEQYEKRKDAQLAREFTISLPRELTIEQNKALITEFVTHEFVSKGMIADVCFHNDLMKDGNRQPHAHVMLTLREVNEDGFGKKVRDWNNKELLLQWREYWSISANHHLALNGFDVQIDHRSNEARGIELEPQYKIGPSASEERMARFADHQRIARENGEFLLERPEIALDALTKEQSTFTHQDLARFVNRHTQDEAQFNQVFATVKASKELVFLGLDTQGKQRFSTKNMLSLEASMMCHADTLDKRLDHEVSETVIGSAKATRQLSLEQETALHYLIAKGDLKSVVGYAGTGKSYLLGAAREVWEASGYRVQGVALSGIAALNLKNSSNIESRTIASFFYHLDQGRLHLSARDILVVDEASQKPHIVSVNTVHYKHLEHGYATTVYKAQGVTVDRSYVLPSKHYDAHSTYVAMTRHRKSCDVFVSREAFPNDKVMHDILNRNRAKDLTKDYTQMDTVLPSAEKEIMVNHEEELTKKTGEHSSKEPEQRAKPEIKQKMQMRERELEMDR